MFYLQKIKQKIKNFTSVLSRKTWLLFFCFISIFIFGLIFNQIKMHWANDPFQKIVLAPLAEETTKLGYAFLFFLAFATPIIYFNIKSKTPNVKINYINLFRYTFVFFAVIAGLCFGYDEFIHQGGVNSPTLHFSLTTMAGILFVVSFDRLKDTNKKWALLTVVISMFFHSIANQYTNFTSVNSNNLYLVSVAKFLQNNTYIKDQTIYSNTLFVIAVALILLYLIKYIFVPFIYKSKIKKASIIEKINLKYWFDSYSNVIILSVFLLISGFLLITGIWYDFIINISAGLICSLITVYLFTYLFERKEKIIWKSVENEVKEDLKIELSGLLIDIMLPIERAGGRYAIKLPEGKDPNEVFREHRLEQFMSLVKADGIKFADTYKPLLAKGKFGTLFINRKKNLNEFEYKYSKHLEPNIILSLIKLQRYLRRIDTAINIKAGKKSFLESDEDFFNRLSIQFHAILKELHFLYELKMVELY